MISSHVGRREGVHLRLVWLDDEIGGCCPLNVKLKEERSQEVCLGKSNEWRSSRKVKEVKMKRPSLLNVRWAQLRWLKTCHFEQKAFGSARKILSIDPAPRLAALRQKVICCHWFKEKRSFFASTHKLENRTFGSEGNVDNREVNGHFQQASYKKANTKVNIRWRKLSAKHL